MAKGKEPQGDLLDDAKSVFEQLDFAGQKQFLDELTAAHEGAKSARINALKAELQALGGSPATPKRGRVGGGERASPKAVYRSPDGSQTYSGRGRLPRWATDMGITDKEGLEPYRIKD